MLLQQPFWLLLIIPLGLLWYNYRLPTRLLNILRGILLVLLCLALAEPLVKLKGRAMTTVVVADRSASMPPETLATQRETISLVQSGMKGSDQLAVVAVGEGASVEQLPQKSRFTGFISGSDQQRSDLAQGIETGLSLIPGNRSGRILLLSDGRWTGGSPIEKSAKAATRGIPIDYRHFARPRANDLSIQEIQAPTAVAPRESYILTGWIRVPFRQEIEYKLQAGKETIAAGSREMKAGLHKLMFRDSAEQPGTKQYTLSISSPNEDPLPQNNLARRIVGVRGEKPMLCVTPTRQSSLPALLEKGGIDTEQRLAGECTWSLSDISSYSAVLLENISATDLGNQGMQNLAAWVEESGGGLFMTGGENSFGPGGYFKSPLEPIMPVSMELRKEHRKLRLAIAVALDRSGSMTASAGGGNTKMDLANIGTVQVLDLLSDMDEIGVVAVDSSPHVIADMDAVPNNRSQRSRILSIASKGGGIFVYEALQSAVKMLGKAEAGTRHIILFADAADSEHPSKYRELLEKCAQANITVSVVGLGTRGDNDADLLMDIAHRGQGRCFFTSNPSEIPRLFAQDTFCVARSAFIKEPTTLQIVGGWPTLFGSMPETMPGIGGYNLCYLRKDSICAAISKDEYEAPIIAAWNAGNGRVLCYTGEADGQFTGPLAKWPAVGQFFNSMSRWTMGKEGNLPGGMLLTQSIRDGMCRIELHLNSEEAMNLNGKAPEVRLLRGKPGQRPESSEYFLAWESAELLACDIPFKGDETLLATVHLNGYNPVSLPPIVLPYSPEFKPPQANKGLTTLGKVARITKGRQLNDLASIWEHTSRKKRHISLTPWILIVALVVFLAEILQRRTGIFASNRIGKRGVSTENASEQDSPPPRPRPRSGTGESRDVDTRPSKKQSENQQQSQSEPPPANTLDAMRRARKRANRRTRR